MKYVKTLVFGSVAAAALMAYLGAGTASATVLCSEPGTGSPVGTTCPAGKAYSSGTSLHAVLDPGTGGSTLTNGYKDINCSEATIAGSTSTEGSASTAVSGAVTTLFFSSCNCEVKVLKTGSFEIQWISGTHNGTLKSSGTEVTTTCDISPFGLVHCIYVTNGTDLGTFTGGNPATVDIASADIPRLATNLLCDEAGNWDAKYEVTSPKPLYVASHT